MKFLLIFLITLNTWAVESGDLQIISVDASGNNFGGIFSKTNTTPLDGSEGSTTTDIQASILYGRQVFKYMQINLLLGYQRSETEQSGSSSSTRSIEFGVGASWNFSSNLARTFVLSALMGFAPTKRTQDNSFIDGTSRFVQFDLARRFTLYDQNDFALCYVPRISYRTTSYGGDFANAEKGNLDSDSRFSIHFLAFDILF